MFSYMMAYGSQFYPFRGWSQEELCMYLTGYPPGDEDEDREIKEALLGELWKLEKALVYSGGGISSEVRDKIKACRAFIYALLNSCPGYLGPLYAGILLIEDDFTFIRSVIRNYDILWT